MGAQSPDDLTSFSRPQLCGSLNMRTPSPAKARALLTLSLMPRAAGPPAIAGVLGLCGRWSLRTSADALANLPHERSKLIVRIPLASDSWTNFLAWFRVDIDGGMLARFRQSRRLGSPESLRDGRGGARAWGAWIPPGRRLAGRRKAERRAVRLPLSERSWCEGVNRSVCVPLPRGSRLRRRGRSARGPGRGRPSSR